MPLYSGSMPILVMVARIPRVRRSPYSLVSRMPTPISTTRHGVPMLFRLQARVLSSTVAALCTQIRSIFMWLAIGTSLSAVSSLMRIWGSSRKKILLAWISTARSAPWISSTIFFATYSCMEPPSLPGKILFISRSKPGRPR